MMHTAPPSGAAHQNRDRYVPLTDDERLVFFFDSTLLSSGKKGVVGTDKRIIAFQKEAARQYPIAEIERLERRVTPGPAGLIVVTRGGERDDITPLTAGPADVDAMIRFLGWSHLHGEALYHDVPYAAGNNHGSFHSRSQ